MKISCCIILLFAYYSGAGQPVLDSLQRVISSGQGLAKAKAYNRLAAYYKPNDPDTALYFARKALEVNAPLKDEATAADAYGNLAESHCNKSQFDSAGLYFVKAIRISEKINNSRQLASFYNGIGIVFYQTGNVEKAISYMRKAAAIKLSESDLLYYATINCNIAGAYQRLGKFSEAIAILRDSESELKNVHNTEILANVYNSLGSAYQLQAGNLDSAEYYYKKNISLITDPKYDFFRLAAFINLGDLYAEENKFTQAQDYLSEALALVSRLHREGIEKVHIYNSLSDLYRKKNDFESALKFKDLRDNLKDSIFNLDRQKVTQELEARYQAEKKDLQIKQQELQIEKESNRQNKIFIVLMSAVFLMAGIIIYFISRKRAKDAIEKAKQTFFSNVVHEIRTPLTMIQAPLEVLKKNKRSEDDLYHIGLAEKNIGRLNELVNQMLDIAKIESNKYKLGESLGNLDAFFDGLMKDYILIAGQKNISLIVQRDVYTGLLFFDKDVLEKITGNLLSNALKYTPEYKQVGISVTTNEQESRLALDIVVWDMGSGISKPDQEKIFERFYRSSAAPGQARGEGIGLSLVKDLVDLYHGSIELVSAENKGTTFTVHLDLRRHEQLTVASKAQPDDGSRSLVLIIEDSPDILEFNRRLLENEGYACITASNGLEALQLLEKTLPDLVLCDVMMPGMDGIAFLDHLKTNPTTDHIPFVFLSAKASPGSRMEALEAGAQAYLAKPFLPGELLALVKNQLAVISKNQAELEAQIRAPEKTAEEKFNGLEPFTQKLFKLIFDQFDSSSLTVEGLADLMAVNRSHFQRKVKALTGHSPSDLVRMIRLEKAREFLSAKKGNITEVAYMCGFSSQSYFTKCFTEYFSETPSAFLQKK